MPEALSTALRRFRRPIAVRVGVEQGCPAQVIVNRPELGGGRVERCAGPWRTSGAWWADSGLGARDSGLGGGPPPQLKNAALPWNRDEWDVALADGTVCRLFQDRDSRQWFLDGVMD